LGDNHVDTATSYDNIGSVYYLLQDHEKATEFIEKGLKIRQSFLGVTHVDIASSYHNLGLVKYMDDYYEA